MRRGGLPAPVETRIGIIILVVFILITFLVLISSPACAAVLRC